MSDPTDPVTAKDGGDIPFEIQSPGDFLYLYGMTEDEMYTYRGDDQ